MTLFLGGRMPEAATRKTPNWKHFSHHWTVFIILVLLHVAPIVVLSILKTRYDQEAAGQSTATSSGSNLFFFAENDVSSYVLWQFMAVIYSVLVGVVWELVDLTTRRLEPFHQLSRPQGALIEDSLALNYVTKFHYFVPVSSLKRRHWAVAMSSTAYVLAFSALPALSSAMFPIQWTTKDFVGLRVATVQINSGVVVAVQVVNAISAALAVSLMAMLYLRRSGLYRDPKQIGGIASLICESNITYHFMQLPSWKRRADINETFRRVRFYLMHKTFRLNDGSIREAYQIDSDIPPHARIVAPSGTYVRNMREARGNWLSVRVVVGVMALFLTTMIIATAVSALKVPAFFLGKVDDYSQNIQPGLAKALYTTVITVTAALMQCIHRDIAIFQPWRYLARGTDPHRFRQYLERDFLSFGLLGSLCQSVCYRAKFVIIGTLGSVIMLVGTVFLPPVWELIYDMVSNNSKYDGLPEVIRVNSVAVIVLFFVIGGFILLNLVLIVATGQTRPIMPRQPTSIASVILYLCNSPKLLAEYQQTSLLDRKGYTSRLKTVQKSCGFGLFANGAYTFVGVEEEPRVGVGGYFMGQNV